MIFFFVEKFPDISHQHLQETEKISAFFLLRDLIQRGTYLVQDRSLQQESITGAKGTFLLSKNQLDLDGFHDGLGCNVYCS